MFPCCGGSVMATAMANPPHSRTDHQLIDVRSTQRQIAPVLAQSMWWCRGPMAYSALVCLPVPRVRACWLAQEGAQGHTPCCAERAIYNPGGHHCAGICLNQIPRGPRHSKPGVGTRSPVSQPPGRGLTFTVCVVECLAMLGPLGPGAELLQLSAWCGTSSALGHCSVRVTSVPAMT